MSAEHHPTGEPTAAVAAGQTPPSWRLQLTADDFNALQPLLIVLQLAGEHDNARKIINLSLQLRAWAEGKPALWGCHGWDEACNCWSVEDDALPLMLLTSRWAGQLVALDDHGVPIPMEVGLDTLPARLFDLAFRIARHATQGRVGSILIPNPEQ